MLHHSHKIRKNFKRLLWLLAITIFLGPMAPALSLEDAIIAVVNDEVITYQDLRDYLETALLRLRIEKRPKNEIDLIMNELQSAGINKLIKDKLLLSEADKRGITIKEEVIDERLEEIKAQYPSPQAFLDSLTADGYTLTDMRNKIRDQIKIQSVIETEVRSKIKINPQEVTKYYETNRDQFIKPERINVDSIFVAATQPPQPSRQKIQEALAALGTGRTFREVARQYSETPPIGTIVRGELLPEIEKVVFNLAEGEISPVVEVEQGFYIFKHLGKIPRQEAALDDVKTQIRNTLFEEKFQKEFASWVTKLEDRAYIDIKE